MEVLNKGDQKIKGYPISFSFNEGEKVKVLSYGKEITEIKDEEFEKMLEGKELAKKISVEFRGKTTLRRANILGRPTI